MQNLFKLFLALCFMLIGLVANAEVFGTKSQKEQMYYASISEEYVEKEADLYEEKWEIQTLISNDKSVKAYEDFPGEKEIEKYSK